MINLLASEIKTNTIKNIKNAKYFSIILDCTLNASHQEQISFVLWCIDVSLTQIQVFEYFLEFLKVDDTIGKNLLMLSWIKWIILDLILVT